MKRKYTHDQPSGTESFVASFQIVHGAENSLFWLNIDFWSTRVRANAIILRQPDGQGVFRPPSSHAIDFYQICYAEYRGPGCLAGFSVCPSVVSFFLLLWTSSLIMIFLMHAHLTTAAVVVVMIWC